MDWSLSAKAPVVVHAGPWPSTAQPPRKRAKRESVYSGRSIVMSVPLASNNCVDQIEGRRPGDHHKETRENENDHGESQQDWQASDPLIDAQQPGLTQFRGDDSERRGEW